MKKSVILAMLLVGMPPVLRGNAVPDTTAVPAPVVLTLEDCRQMALSANKDLDQARTAMQMAAYDRKIARAQYFPEVSATGAYLYNNRDLALISEAESAALLGVGPTLQGYVNRPFERLYEALSVLPEDLQAEIAAAVHAPDVATPINRITGAIDADLHPDLHQIWAGAITVTQPVFVGGKIVYSNQIAALAEELAQARYDQQFSEVLVDVDQAYWQIVSLSAKKELAEAYADLLHHLLKDAQAAVAAGAGVPADVLQVQVKAHDADMLLTKAGNGLALSKMLLCKRIGLPLDTPVRLVDEGAEVLPAPGAASGKTMDAIWADRPETRSLALASSIYERKAKVARADLMPTVALVGSCLVTNPNAYDGFQSSWRGAMLSGGVLVRMPLFHGMEQVNRYRKAKAEAGLYTSRYEDACQMIDLQVSQQRKLYDEAVQQVTAAAAGLAAAEENLRAATVGYDAGVVSVETVLGAQTAWLSAHAALIDAGSDAQLSYALLQRAEGAYTTEEQKNK